MTHQTQWLHSCSRVIVLQAGTILADAPWKRLQHSDNLPQGLSNLTAPDQRVQDAQSNPGVHILVPSSHPPPHMTQHNPNHSQKSLHLERDPDLNGAGDNGSPPGHPTADEAAAHSSPMGATLAEPGQEDEAAVDADTVGAVGSVSIPTDSRQKWDSSARVAVGAVDTKDVEVKAGYENDTEKEGKAESLPGSSVVELAATSKAAVSSPKRPSDGTSSDDTCAPSFCRMPFVRQLHHPGRLLQPSTSKLGSLNPVEYNKLSLLLFSSLFRIFHYDGRHRQGTLVWLVGFIY